MRKNMQLRWVAHAEARAAQEHATQQRAASEPPVNVDYIPNSSGRFHSSLALITAALKRRVAKSKGAVTQARRTMHALSRYLSEVTGPRHLIITNGSIRSDSAPTNSVRSNVVSLPKRKNDSCHCSHLCPEYLWHHENPINRPTHAPHASKQNNEEERMVELTCSMPAFDRLTTAVKKGKQETETIRVRVDDLQALMIDHARLLRAAIPYHTPKEYGPGQLAVRPPDLRLQL